MERLKRVLYVGMITTDTYGKVVGEKAYAGAAARKMTSVVCAMRSVGQRAIILSLPFVGTQAKRALYPPVVTSDGKVPAVFLATLRSKYLRKLFVPFFLAVFAWRRVSVCDTVILYNHAVEYLPALAILRLKGVKVVQDIEDAPTVDEGGMRGVLNRVSFAVTFRFTEPRKMVVAEHVAKELKLDDYVVIRGVALNDRGLAGLCNTAKWEDLQAGGELKLHYGGTLIPDTGIDLFCESIELLAHNEGRLDRRVVFKVTGVGELGKIRTLQERIQTHRKVNVELLPELSMADYVALIDTCHGSLSLKRPESSMSNTTFPSKVIEITSAGVALVSTRLGDVVSLFNDESVFFLQHYDAVDLVDIIVDMAQASGRVERVAKAGLDVCSQTFSAKAIGEKMARLI